MSVVLAVLRRDWAVKRTYQLRLFLEFTDTAVLAVGIYFIGKLIDDPAALAEYGGNYFDFVIVGLAVTSFAGVGLASFGDAVGREQSTGTMDLLLVSPAPLWRWLAGMIVFPFLVATLQMVLLLTIGIGVLGSGIPLGGLVMSIPIILLTTTTFAAVGVVAAGIILLAKRGDPISGPFYQASLLVSGAIVPLEVLPRFIEVIGLALPATWGIRAVRELLLADAGWSDVLPEVLVLIGFVVVMTPASVLVFRSCLRTARRQGLLGTY